MSDSAFSGIPFDKWLSQPGQSHMRWMARVIEPVLSPHQRLAARVFVQVDGRELAKRRGQGMLLVLVQVNDEKGQAWQNHLEMDLERLEEGMKANDAVFSQTFFVLPGDYTIAVALYDTATREHTITKRRLHVAALRNDPLPGAWRDLPAVEFVPLEKPPDSWYLPSVDDRLRIEAGTREPAHVDLVVNLTPSERFTGSSRVQNRNMGALLPATKVLSQVDWRNDFAIALLDLARRRTTWQQDDGRPLDWGEASRSLDEIKPGIIDIKALEYRMQSAQFFVNEIARRLTGRKREIMIVLSSPVEFEPGQDMRPIALKEPGNAKVFYIRYQPIPLIGFGRAGAETRITMPDGNPAPRSRYVIDQLEPLLAPLGPRLFEVSTPQQFRKALAAILSEIAAG
ncbi:MAG TPA: hypothetical protein VG297_12510 [Bryobacteraceae bacterium]|nr:hypothetical protein [Bryobacteraceae bacterium]